MKKTSDYPPTPELDKMQAIKDKSQAIGEFLNEFCTDKKYELCQYREEGNNGRERYVWKSGVKTAQRNGEPTKGNTPGRRDFLNDDAILNPEFSEWDEGYCPINQSTEKLLAAFFGIDLNKAERERQAILEHLRSK